MNKVAYKSQSQTFLLLCSLVASTSSIANSPPLVPPPSPPTACSATAPATMTPVCGEMSNGLTNSYPNSMIACSMPSVIGYYAGVCPAKPAVVKQAQIAGVITSPSKARLPAGSVVIITLQNDSIADKSAQIVGKQVIQGAKFFPINFTIPYKTSHISSAILQHPLGYGVHARVEKQGKLLFFSDTFTPAFSGGPITIEVK